MSQAGEYIRRLIKSIVDNRIPVVCAWCTVKAVSADGQYCDVLVDGEEDLELRDILLGFEKSGQRFKPVLNKQALVLFSSKTTGVVIMAEQTEQAQLMGNDFGGLAKVQPITQRLNALESDLNTLKNVFKTLWVPVANDGGAALKTASSAWANAPLTQTQVGDLENDKVKHGNGQ